MRVRSVLPLVLALATTAAEAVAQNPEATDPLAELDGLTRARWHAAGSGFETELEYHWLIEGHVLAGENDVRDESGHVIARYRGVYAWDAGRPGIVFWTATDGGEVHRGRAWLEDGVLWHEAEVSGGQIEAYVSAVRLGEDRLEYFADYGMDRADPGLLGSEPLVYTPVEGNGRTAGPGPR